MLFFIREMHYCAQAGAVEATPRDSLPLHCHYHYPAFMVMAALAALSTQQASKQSFHSIALQCIYVWGMMEEK